MALVTFHDVSLEFGDLPILLNADFVIEAGERVCLIGRNGAGKSSMMKLITGQHTPDHGEIRLHSEIQLSVLEQALPGQLDDKVRDHVAAGLASLQALIDEYKRLSASELDREGMKALEHLQHRIEAHGGWSIDQRVSTILSELDLPSERRLGELSGGWQRRVALAKALVSNPDLLLLDEPTNHLDLSTIEWLENKVFNFPGAVLFVTHDRAFLNRIATRIVELDRAKLSSWPGNYKDFLENKAKWLEEEERRNALFDKKLEEEEAWIRQGIKARRTRNEGRVRALEAMREEFAQRIRPQSKARIHVEEAELSGRKVVELRNVTHGFNDERLIEGFSLKIMRGDRIALIGNNGVGKSTLLKIMLGELEPQQGSVKLGTNLEIGYFDQMRRELDPTKTVAELVGDGREYIKINGRERHIVGYLRGFLFSAKRALQPVGALSGGECNRVILARLFARPTNLLVLDEPTNDLDVETLEVLEDRLSDYQGTLLVVSHDREFVDNVVTSTLVFESVGKIQIYPGGYSDWLARGRLLREVDDPERDRRAAQAAAVQTAPRETGGKLSYKFKLELERLPDRIETLEKDLETQRLAVAVNGFYDRPYAEVQTALEKLAATEHELDAAMTRWMELEAMAEGAAKPG
ncbi:MAG: ATP-binding cassette domain-containing protein [Gammaproteobacteria bacterium]|nr:ATP-binding cassette domain-containing protein [Gammaproteobacteria bacterium]MBI5619047.1 ATP-binding cassette domain-containing protein [Gammaproteobacteria bacterium]